MHLNWNLQIIYGYHFFNQPRSDIVVFAIIDFQIHNILVIKWKYGIGPSDIITFNEEL